MTNVIVIGMEVLSVGLVIGLAVWARSHILGLMALTCDELEERAFARGFKAGYRCRDDAREVWCPDGELLGIFGRN